MTTTAQLAQSVEHMTVNHRVAGPSPALGAILFWPVGEVVQHTCLSRMHSWVQIPYGSPIRILEELFISSFLHAFFVFFILFSMYDKEVEDRLKQLKIEDFIWIIYLGIIFLSYFSNSLERKYFVSNDLNCREKYRNIMVIIFSILVFVYFYFLYDSYSSIKGLNEFDTEKKKRLVYLSFLASLLIFISGLLFLYIAISDTDLNVEIAFN